MAEKTKTEPGIQVKQMMPFKLKDKVGRSRFTLNLMNTFRFVPETIIIEKVHGRNNTIRISAVLTKEELENEKKLNKKSRKKGKRVAKKKSKAN